MFWIVDNFLMRRQMHKGDTKVNGNNPSVKFHARPHDMGISDDEVVLHSLIDNESRDMIADEYEVTHRKEHAP